MEIKELDLTVDGLEDVLGRTEEIFSGILGVIEELETELETLKNEQAELESSESYTASKLKRRAVIGSEIVAIEGGLTKAKEEHQRIVETHANELKQLENQLKSKYNAKLREATKELKKQALDKARESEALLAQINKLMQDGKTVYNQKAVSRINEATGVPYNNRIISSDYHRVSVTLENIESDNKRGLFA